MQLHLSPSVTLCYVSCLQSCRIMQLPCFRRKTHCLFLQRRWAILWQVMSCLLAEGHPVFLTQIFFKIYLRKWWHTAADGVMRCLWVTCPTCTSTSKEAAPRWVRSPDTQTLWPSTLNYLCMCFYLSEQLAGVHSTTLNTLPNGTFDLDEMESKIRHGYPKPLYTRSRLICLENTHNIVGGCVLPLTFLQEVCYLLAYKYCPPCLAHSFGSVWTAGSPAIHTRQSSAKLDGLSGNATSLGGGWGHTND